MNLTIPIRNILKNPSFWLFAAVVVFMLLSANFAHASSAGTGLPWEGPLQKIVKSFSGPVAFAISLIGLIAAGVGLIWGGEIGGFLRTMVYIILVISVLVFATSILSKVFNAGALIPADGLVMQAKMAHASLVNGLLK